MKQVIKLFMYLYEKVGLDTNTGRKAMVMDWRNYGHGFFATIIGVVALFGVAEYMNYDAYWALFGISAALGLAFIAGIAVEIFQMTTIDGYEFNWQDVWATNIWFLPLFFIYGFLHLLAPKAYREAEKEMIYK